MIGLGPLWGGGSNGHGIHQVFLKSKPGRCPLSAAPTLPGAAPRAVCNRPPSSVPEPQCRPMCRLRPSSNRLCPGWSQLRLRPPPEPQHPGSNQWCTLPARPCCCCWRRRGCLCPHRLLRSHLRRSLALSLSLCLTATLSLSTLVLLLNILSIIFHRLAHLMVFLSSSLSHLSPPLFFLLFLVLVFSSSSFPPLPRVWCSSAQVWRNTT